MPPLARSQVLKGADPVSVDAVAPSTGRLVVVDAVGGKDQGDVERPFGNWMRARPSQISAYCSALSSNPSSCSALAGRAVEERTPFEKQVAILRWVRVPLQDRGGLADDQVLDQMLFEHVAQTLWARTSPGRLRLVNRWPMLTCADDLCPTGLCVAARDRRDRDCEASVPCGRFLDAMMRAPCRRHRGSHWPTWSSGRVWPSTCCGPG